MYMWDHRWQQTAFISLMPYTHFGICLIAWKVHWGEVGSLMKAWQQSIITHAALLCHTESSLGGRRTKMWLSLWTAQCFCARSYTNNSVCPYSAYGCSSAQLLVRTGYFIYLSSWSKYTPVSWSSNASLWSKRAQVLITTDTISMSSQIPSVKHVIHFDMLNDITEYNRHVRHSHGLSTLLFSKANTTLAHTILLSNRLVQACQGNL